MFIMNVKLILNDPESSSQDGIQRSHLQDGLRILVRIITRDLMARRSAHTKKDDLKVNDKHVSEDS